MTGAELAALVAGTGVLMLAFAAFNIASHSLLDSRLRIFVRRAPNRSSSTLISAFRRALKKMSACVLRSKLRRARFYCLSSGNPRVTMVLVCC